MVTHGAKSTHEKENVLRAPPRLGGGKKGDEQRRCADEKEKISPPI
jgi:hypothetical protein